MMIFAMFCLGNLRIQAYAQNDSEAERLCIYSSSYQAEDEIPDAPEEYNDGKISYRLVETEIEEVPVRDRSKEVSGEILYEAVNKAQEIPENAPMEVDDKESREKVSLTLPLQKTSYENERWQDGFEISVVFHEYGAETYRLGEMLVSHDSENPPLDECKKELMATVGLSEEDVEIESALWNGEAYQDEEGIWCRDAIVNAKRRVWDCRAVYAGTARLREYNRYRMRMEYEKTEPDVSETAAPKSTAEVTEDRETKNVENKVVPLWKRWIRYALTISVSLLLILLAITGFQLLKKIGRETKKR